ncbi:hypothetical protein [Enterococcus mundtii]|uniref:hypothetical protein n=1 Tax=Enterococcus mundtii TaxID=53346 RepID=UPI001A95AB01|nr:hypothetical protein [Enterococcus mundtii]MBO1087183.1 hypothetical protein [Enterococcus mundtii]
MNDRLVRKNAKKWWVCDSQELIENVYMLSEFGRHFGRDERYWKHHKQQLKVINQLDLSSQLVLPFVYAVKGVRTVVLLEFDIEKSENIAPMMIESWEDDNIVAMLQEI